MTAFTPPDKHVRPRKWWPWIVGFGTAWGLILALLAPITDPTPENYTLAVSVWFAGLYTLGLYATRRRWLPQFAGNPLRNAVILGAFNAAVIETEFLVFEKIFGAEGVAAHPNLLVDLIMTMPWYTLMVLTFVKVQHRWRFSAATVLFLGGVYELGGDGMVGAFMGVFWGNYQLFTLEYWLMMAIMFLWTFIPVYSSMVLPPAWLVATAAPPEQAVGAAWRAALKPMLWLIPFGVYLLAVMLIIVIVSGSG
ncbi:MAG: hypothetical protein ACOYYS_16070 [Chloroflexota bacterium]